MAAYMKRGTAMKRGRYRAALIPGVVASVAALGAVAGTAVAATSHTATSHTATGYTGASLTTGRAARVTAPVAFNCGHAQVRPRDFILTCADGNSYLTKLSWTTWTSPFPTATGTQMINNCIPYCADGTFRSYPVDVVFWRREPLPHHPGVQYFTRVTVLYPAARPPAYYRGKQNSGPETWTGTLLNK
jgi:hypothetical protein